MSSVQVLHVTKFRLIFHTLPYTYTKVDTLSRHAISTCALSFLFTVWLCLVALWFHAFQLTSNHTRPGTLSLNTGNEFSPSDEYWTSGVSRTFFLSFLQRRQTGLERRLYWKVVLFAGIMHVTCMQFACC